MEKIMNREYKFRAWHPQLEKFIEIDHLFLEHHSKWVLMSSYNGNISYHWFNKSDAEIMQCTGARDKGGKDIYEGDIVFCSDDMDFYPIVFHSAMFCVYNRNDDTYSPLYEYLHDSFVVGNKFQNPNYITDDPAETLKKLNLDGGSIQPLTEDESN
jgi:uncharacterized phage protein (TIGR01671 family)